MKGIKGHPRYGGRKKGTPNASSLNVKAIAEARGVDPAEIICSFIEGNWKNLGFESKSKLVFGKDGTSYEIDHITIDHRLKAAGMLLEYIYPKLKAIEHTGSVKTETSVVVYKAKWGLSYESDTDKISENNH